MIEAMDVDTDEAYAKAKRSYVFAAVGIALGLAVAGTLDRTAGGVVLLAAWIAGVAALHRLGRTGSSARS
jgi:hypothetical protein